MKAKQRFVVIGHSVTWHCCFKASVLDTGIPHLPGHRQVICECFKIKEAEKIASALNAGVSFDDSRNNNGERP